MPKRRTPFLALGAATVQLAVEKPGCMLEHPSIRRYSSTVTPSSYDVAVGSDNPTGADDQQETRSSLSRLELDPMWVVGFVDGEGCFCVSVHRNVRFAKRTGGWQLHPVFQVYQHHRHRAVLEGLIEFFGCGRIRPKGPKSSVLTYAVDSLIHLEGTIVPFFERHPLVVKHRDFVAFAEIVRSLRAKEHFTAEGFERLVRLAYGMNVEGKQRARHIDEVLGSSETARRASFLSSAGGAAKIQSDLHGDMQSQAEMT